jgi:TonB family protein
MTLLIDSTLKVTLVIAVGLTLARLLAGRSAALRHWVLTVTVLCALATPVLERVVPAWGPLRGFATASHQSSRGAPVVPPPPATALEISEFIDPLPGAPPVDTGVFGLLAPAWLVGALASVLMLGAGLARLAWLASRAERITSGPWLRIAREVEAEYALGRQAQVLESEHPSLLVTWGLLRPRIIIPRAAQRWSDQRIRVVLRHELAHVRRGDWFVQIAGELLRAAYWFNPLVWIACAHLRQESEHACDDEVLIHGVDGQEYATHLLELARTLKSAPSLPAPAVVRSSGLERRIRAMLNTRLIRTPTSPSVRSLTAAVLVASAVAIAAAQTGSVRLSGTIVDGSGAPVPGVAVVLINAQTQAKHQVATDQNGRYEFVPLPADAYRLQATRPAFEKYDEAVTLTGSAVRRDFTLALGTLKETISVKAERGVEGGVPGGVRGGVSGGVAGGTVESYRSSFRKEVQECKASTEGGRVRPPRKIKDVRPVYPDDARSAGIGGTVLLQATITADGTVGDVQVLRSVHPALDNAAVEAVKQWEFDGTLLNCSPTPVVMTVSVDFGIQQPSS